MLHVQVTINVCVFVFDLLYVDGESLVHLPLRVRRDRMSTSLSMRPGYLQAAQALEFPPHLTPSGAPAIESSPIKAPSATPADAIAAPKLETHAEHITAATAPSPAINTRPVPARDASPKPDIAKNADEGMRSKPHGAAGDIEDMRSDEPPQAEGTDEEMRWDGGDVSGGEAEPGNDSDGGSDVDNDGDDELQPEAKRVKHEQSGQPPAEGHPLVTASDAQVWPCWTRIVKFFLLLCTPFEAIADVMLSARSIRTMTSTLQKANFL